MFLKCTFPLINCHLLRHLWQNWGKNYVWTNVKCPRTLPRWELTSDLLIVISWRQALEQRMSSSFRLCVYKFRHRLGPGAWIIKLFYNFFTIFYYYILILICQPCKHDYLFGNPVNIITHLAILQTLEHRNSTLQKCKQLLEYQHLLLLRDIWWSKYKSIYKCSSLIEHQC